VGSGRCFIGITFLRAFAVTIVNPRGGCTLCTLECGMVSSDSGSAIRMPTTWRLMSCSLAGLQKRT